MDLTELCQRIVTEWPEADVDRLTVEIPPQSELPSINRNRLVQEQKAARDELPSLFEKRDSFQSSDEEARTICTKLIVHALKRHGVLSVPPLQIRGAPPPPPPPPPEQGGGAFDYFARGYQNPRMGPRDSLVD